MKTFLLQICWMMLIIWGATKVAFAQQVIEPAQVFITSNEAACVLAGAPTVNGGCKAHGHLEGTVEGKWRLHTEHSPQVVIESKYSARPPVHHPLQSSNEAEHDTQEIMGGPSLLRLGYLPDRPDGCCPSVWLSTAAR
ncbi:hypothetical protein [Pseudomonas sp. EMN2]|uniref:hypothetical protein n=1 Tax=Pseudomonas sp. EMN2 TaxID=2615212 RepID=UPI00129BBE1D|nr:hypothetical protein [Pseudomonas sp. EMN2]